jgi:hypothetical protein
MSTLKSGATRRRSVCGKQLLKKPFYARTRYSPSADHNPVASKPSRIRRASPNLGGYKVPTDRMPYIAASDANLHAFNALAESLLKRTANMKEDSLIHFSSHILQGNPYELYCDANGGLTIRPEGNEHHGSVRGLYIQPNGTCSYNGTPMSSGAMMRAVYAWSSKHRTNYSRLRYPRSSMIWPMAAT